MVCRIGLSQGLAGGDATVAVVRLGCGGCLGSLLLLGSPGRGGSRRGLGRLPGRGRPRPGPGDRDRSGTASGRSRRCSRSCGAAPPGARRASAPGTNTCCPRPSSTRFSPAIWGGWRGFPLTEPRPCASSGTASSSCAASSTWIRWPGDGSALVAYLPESWRKSGGHPDPPRPPAARDRDLARPGQGPSLRHRRGLRRDGSASRSSRWSGSSRPTSDSAGGRSRTRSAR